MNMPPADEQIFLSEQHPESSRWSVFEDDGISAWLYLTAPDSQQPVADCWVYNRIESPEPAGTYAARGIAPPAPPEITTDSPVMNPAGSSAIRVEWSPDGESIAIFLDELLMGFIDAGSRRGYSRNLTRPGPWGNPLDEQLYGSVFGARA